MCLLAEGAWEVLTAPEGGTMVELSLEAWPSGVWVQLSDSTGEACVSPEAALDAVRGSPRLPRERRVSSSSGGMGRRVR